MREYLNYILMFTTNVYIKPSSALFKLKFLITLFFGIESLNAFIERFVYSLKSDIFGKIIIQKH